MSTTSQTQWSPRYDFPDLSSADYIAFDCETRDPELDSKGPGGFRGSGELVGISVAVPGWGNYFPIRHQGGDNLSEDAVLRWLKKTLGGSNPKIGANISYDCEWLAVNGVDIGGDWHDIQIREALLDENLLNYDADTLFTKYGVGGKAHELLFTFGATQGHRTEKQVKQNLWRYPARYVAEYAIQDARGALEVFFKQEPDIKEKASKVYELELRVTKMLFAMRKRGVPVDINRAEQAVARLRAVQKESQEKLNHLAGFNVDVWSGKSIAAAFNKIGLQYPVTEKGNPSFTKEFLESYGHDIPRAIVEIRKMDRAGGVFIEKKIIEYSVRGTLFPSFRQTRSSDGGTRSGRLASANPNIQQVPARDEILAPIIRSCFVPPPGYFWGVFDYSQQEPRITVHYSAIRNFTGAHEARSRYIQNPDTDYHDLTRALVLEQSGVAIKRKDAKTINLGLTYTMGGAKLCRRLGLPTILIPHWRNPDILVEMAGPEGKAILDAYHKGMPFIRELMDDCTNVVTRRGYIRTALGRRCHLPGNRSHIAINRLIQGTAADMTKLAMLNMWDAGYLPFIQVHDEVDNPIEIGNLKQAKEIVDIMVATAADMGITVPMKVDVELGPSWGETKEYKYVDLHD